MDTVIGKASGPVLVTMVERMSRYTIIAKAPHKADDAVAMAIMVRLLSHRSELHSLTFDNSLIRRYFPKGTNFGRITEDQIAEVEQTLNSRPRKYLETKTPASISLSN